MPASYPFAGEFSNGFSNMPRTATIGGVAGGAGYALFAGFTAPQTMTVTSIAFYISTPATTTGAFVGIYSLDNLNNAVLLRTTSNVNALITNASGYTKVSLGAGGVHVNTGGTYAVGILLQGTPVLASSPAIIAYTGPEVPIFAAYTGGGLLAALPLAVLDLAMTSTSTAIYYELLAA